MAQRKLNPKMTEIGWQAVLTDNLTMHASTGHREQEELNSLEMKASGRKVNNSKLCAITEAVFQCIRYGFSPLLLRILYHLGCGIGE